MVKRFNVEPMSSIQTRHRRRHHHRQRRSSAFISSAVVHNRDPMSVKCQLMFYVGCKALSIAQLIRCPVSHSSDAGFTSEKQEKSLNRNHPFDAVRLGVMTARAADRAAHLLATATTVFQTSCQISIERCTKSQ